MNSVLERVYEIGIIPVIAFNSVDEAIPLCKALMDGGLPAAEVTFRTACAEECICPALRPSRASRWCRGRPTTSKSPPPE